MLIFSLILLSLIPCTTSNPLAHQFLKTDCIYGYIDNYKDTTNSFICYYGPQSLLQFLLFPISINEFIDEYHDKQPLLIQRDGDSQYYSSLNIMNSYKEILPYLDTRSDIKDSNGLGSFPELTMTHSDRPGHHIQPMRADRNQGYLASLSAEDIETIRAYHAALNNDLGPWDRTAVDYMSNNNLTLKFQKLETHLFTLRDLCKAFTNQIGFGVRSSMYIMPPFDKGDVVKYNTDEAWILQINNSAHWKIYHDLYHYCYTIQFKDKMNLCQTYVINDLLPNGYEQIRPIVAEKDDASMDFELNEGDFLYIPRGWLYKADTLEFGKHSVDITINVYLELYNDCLFQMIRYLFTVSDAKKIFKKIFHIKEVGVTDYKNVKVIRKYVLKDLDAWLRTVTFKDDALGLRESVPMFYHFDDMDENGLYDNLIKLFESHWYRFMDYIDKESEKININMYTDALQEYTQELMDVLKDDESKEKVWKKLFEHYGKILKSFEVYYPHEKSVYKQYKRISWPMRLEMVRKQVPLLVWE